MSRLRVVERYQLDVDVVSLYLLSLLLYVGFFYLWMTLLIVCTFGSENRSCHLCSCAKQSSEYPAFVESLVRCLRVLNLRILSCYWKT